jgi:uncharacterized protein YjbI with pentapeptide repeats
MKALEIEKLLELHKKWLYGEGGVRANLRSADLRSADLHGADLSSADLYGADLHGADLSSANLRSADLHGADLSGANLNGANLSSANLRSADLHGADLRSADLSGAHLRSADLRGADLRCTGNMKELRTIQVDRYMIGFTKDILQIGCKTYTIDEWRNFTDKEISKMDEGALDWWNKWKDWIFQAIDLSYVKE